MTPEELDAIRRRNENRKTMKAAATPGPWMTTRLYRKSWDGTEEQLEFQICTDVPIRDVASYRGTSQQVEVDEHPINEGPVGLSMGDAEFIVDAQNSKVEEDVDALLAKVERLLGRK